MTQNDNLSGGQLSADNPSDRIPATAKSPDPVPTGAEVASGSTSSYAPPTNPAINPAPSSASAQGSPRPPAAPPYGPPTPPQQHYGRAPLGAAPYGQAPLSAAHGVDGSSTNPTKTRKGTSVGIVAALAVGALIGGISGAGVATMAINASASSGAPIASGATNITVNDPLNATSVTAVAASAGPSVVTISVADSTGSGGTGSGVILTEDGYVVTNTHVVTLDGASATPTVSVQLFDGRIFPAEIVGTDPISDLAVIKIDNGDATFQPAEFADSSKLNVGDTAVAIGSPLGLANTVTDGIVSSLNRSITVASSAVPEDQQEEAPDSGQSPFDFWQLDPTDPQRQQPVSGSSTIALTVIQTDAAINPGNSGGALLDSDGKVIGINVAIASAGSNGSSTSGSIGVGFAIPSNLAKRISSEIMETGSATHGLLGASIDDVDPTNSKVVGAVVMSVTNDGAARAGGLRAGDVVTAINGLPVTGKTDLTAQVRALAAGADATISYVRDGKSTTAKVTLGSLG